MTMSKLSQTSQLIEKLEAEVTALTNRRNILLAGNKTLELKRETALKSQADELKQLRQQALAKLRAELAPVKSEIDAAEITRQTAISRRDEANRNADLAQHTLDGLSEPIETAKHTLASLNAEIVAQGKRSEQLTEDEILLLQKIGQANDRLNHISEQITLKKVELGDLVVQIDKIRGDLADLQLDYDARKTAADDELRGVLVRTQDAVIRLKEVTGREEQEREALALERQVIQKEREALDRRTAKLNTDEGRIAKYGQYMRL
jgi:chromosome segregation ATPase